MDKMHFFRHLDTDKDEGGGRGQGVKFTYL
jgi:hypothetical protein